MATWQGTRGNDNYTGTDGADSLDGGTGDDTLIGVTGRDQLSGGTGQDAFRFAEAPAATGRDPILDFKTADDRLEFSHAAYAALGTQADQADDRLIYDEATGALRYDADGSGAGAAVLIATLTPPHRAGGSGPVRGLSPG
ncbi:M10 family metallopeptidase C-terminal domain-containing protein [Azohydromonas australica]|uniref:M10 family metallopeptidase C-terminal domain-containing protein n=1 Tax=Azohydromonas australica TaxID=364039 RepID=UPI00146A5A50